jgi:hypothetical protein
LRGGFENHNFSMMAISAGAEENQKLKIKKQNCGIPRG